MSFQNVEFEDYELDSEIYSLQNQAIISDCVDVCFHNLLASLNLLARPFW